MSLITKAHSKAKGVLNLPKIDDIYAKLGSFSIYSALDWRSGYYHIALSADSQKKSAFVTPMGKFEFWNAHFGLAQDPAYFPQFINEVLSGLDFAFQYMDDIVMYSSTGCE